MIKMLLIRHGQSENNLLWAQTGSFDGRNEDPELTPVGWQQAEALAQVLRGPDHGQATLDAGWDPQNIYGFGLTHLYCSLMVRAVQTGQVVARALDLPLVGWPEIHETGGIHFRDPETGQPTGRPLSSY